MNSRPDRLWSCLTRSGAALAATVMLASGCATVTTPTPQIAVHAPTALMANASSACRTGWAAAPETRDAALDPDRIALVNWNIKKGSHSDWRDQLEMLTAGADLVTLQEAPLASAGWRDLESDLYHAFAPGWMSRNTPTGVMTLSDAAHLVQCNMQAREPWLRSPKATLATEYALIDRAETLLVVNVHVVNFSLGLAAFDRQLEQVRTVVAQHEGPVILTGDFNTWRRARLDRVQALVDAHDLEAVPFRTDVRKRFLGNPLDHVYVRGLDVIDATTIDTRASDHNPMRVWLSAS
ncbi:MAG: endonuclease/exonuclease/phosphatase family protein [Pseudomonadota bacterium]